MTSNEEWLLVGQVSDIDEDTNLKAVSAFDQAICLYRVEEDIFATQDLCTHGEACLSEGWLEDGTIECPFHQGVFDIATGEPLSPPVTEALRVFRTKVEEGKIYLKKED